MLARAVLRRVQCCVGVCNTAQLPSAPWRPSSVAAVAVPTGRWLSSLLPDGSAVLADAYTPDTLSPRKVQRLRDSVLQALSDDDSNAAYRTFGVLRAQSGDAVGQAVYEALVHHAYTHSKPEVALAVLKDMVATGMHVSPVTLEQVAGVGYDQRRHDVVNDVLRVGARLQQPLSPRLVDVAVRACVDASPLSVALQLVQRAFGQLPSRVRVAAAPDSGASDGADDWLTVPVPPQAVRQHSVTAAADDDGADNGDAAAAAVLLPATTPSFVASLSRSLANHIVAGAAAAGDVWAALRVVELLRVSGLRPSPATFLPVVTVLAEDAGCAADMAAHHITPVTVAFTVARTVSRQALSSDDGLKCFRVAMDACLTAGDLHAATALVTTVQTATGAAHAVLADRVVRSLLRAATQRGHGGGLDDGTAAEYVRRGAAVFGDTVRLAAAAGKDRPHRDVCAAVVSATSRHGLVADALSLLSLMVKHGVPVSRRMMGDVTLGLQATDSSMAVGFALGLALSRRLPLDASRFNLLLGAVAQQGRLQDAQLLLMEMGALGIVPDPKRLAVLATSFAAAGLHDGAAMCRGLLREQAGRSPASTSSSSAGPAGAPPSHAACAPAASGVTGLVHDVSASLGDAKLPDRAATAMVASALLRCTPPQPQQALQLLLQQLASGDAVDTATCVTLVRVCLHSAPELVGTAVQLLDDAGVTPDTPQGRTAVLKALGHCGRTADVLSAFQAALRDGLADTRLCNTALSQCVRHGDVDAAQQVVDAMAVHGVPESNVTAGLKRKLAAVVASSVAPS